MRPGGSAKPSLAWAVAPREPSQSPCPVRLLLAQGPQPLGPGAGAAPTCARAGGPTVHLAAGAAWTRHLRYLILPLRLQPSPCLRAPLGSVDLTSPRARQSQTEILLNSRGCHGVSTALPHPAAEPRLPCEPDVAPASVPLPPLGAEDLAFIPPTHLLQPPRQNAGLTAG